MLKRKTIDNVKLYFKREGGSHLKRDNNVIVPNGTEGSIVVHTTNLEEIQDVDIEEFLGFPINTDCTIEIHSKLDADRPAEVYYYDYGLKEGTVFEIP